MQRQRLLSTSVILRSRRRRRTPHPLALPLALTGISIAIAHAEALEIFSSKTETLTVRAVVQRVSRAQVTVAGEVAGKIGLGLLVLLGVSSTDTEADADYLAAKIAGLRIFTDKHDEDEHGKMDRSVAEVGGGVLVVSQFTLYGDVRRGKRPSFDAAAPPQRARELYEYFVERIRAAGLPCETGRFQEMMQVELVNDGPVTILLDSAKTF